jgi:hypothetical protein
VLIPAFKAAGAHGSTWWRRRPASAAVHAARKFGFEETTTDTAAVLADPRTSMRWSSPPGTTAMPDW